MAAQGLGTGNPDAGSSTLRPGPSGVVPLLGTPFFAVTMVKSNIQRPFQVTVPKNFLKYLPNRRVEAVLYAQNGNGRRSRMVSYYGDMGRFCGGWKDFAEEHNLKLGDGVVFELKDPRRLEFRVQILRKELPSVVVLDD